MAHQVHGRSKQQRYTRAADWSYITACANMAKSPADDGAPPLSFIGNGDVFTHLDFYKHLEDQNVDTCLIGRGALIKRTASCDCISTIYQYLFITVVHNENSVVSLLQLYCLNLPFQRSICCNCS